jgi:hypothetical protein
MDAPAMSTAEVKVAVISDRNMMSLLCSTGRDLNCGSVLFTTWRAQAFDRTQSSP